MATIIHFDGRIEETSPANGHDFSLLELKAIVAEGAPAGIDHIEIIETLDGRILVLNEEGKLYDLPRNEAATKLAKLATPADLSMMKLLLGDALILTDMSFLEGEGADYIAGTVLVCESHEVS